MKDLIETLYRDNPWLDSANKHWYLLDGALREIMHARKMGLYHPPKLYYHLKSRFFEELQRCGEAGYGVAIIRGPRRIGKTSTLKLIIKDLIEEGWNPQSFFYITLDNEGLLSVFNRKRNLRELIEYLLEEVVVARPAFIILDEVTFYKGWARALKNLVDSGSVMNGVGIVATGSYSLDLSSARAELSGRFGPVGEQLGGEIFFPQRRFVEVVEASLGKQYRRYLAKTFGKFGRKMGLLEYLGGYQSLTDSHTYGYEKKIAEFCREYYDTFHGLFEMYMFSGGYPRAIFEMARNLNTDGGISDARYYDDIYNLLLSDSRKFRLNEDLLKNILLNIKWPTMLLSGKLDTISYGLENLKKDEIERYIAYLKSAGAVDILSSVARAEDIITANATVIPSGEKKKLIVNDPALFWSIYFGSRGVTNIYSHIKQSLKGEIVDLLVESIVISHIGALKRERNIAFVHDGRNELADTLLWRLNYKGEFIILAIEIKNRNYQNVLNEMKKRAEILKSVYGIRRTIVVNNSSEFYIGENFVIIPVELFLILF